MIETTGTYNVIVTRLFDAPVGRVWRAWCDSDDVMRWWGPIGFTCPVAEMDVREGGRSLVCMRAPQEFGGQDMYSTWTYTRIVSEQEMEYIFNFTDREGNKFDPAVLGLPAGIPMDVRHLVTFKAIGQQTEMTVTEYGYDNEEVVAVSRMGLEQCLDKMAAIFVKS